MGQHLLLSIRIHGDGNGRARYHGTAQGAPEWPPSPARVFQALVSGGARGQTLPEKTASALEWLEGLPPPVIAAPRAHQGERLSLFVPNNDADTVDDPRDVSSIRTKKVVHPTLFEENVPFLYSWPLPAESSPASVIVEAADELYQLGRGVDMAWAVGELIDDDAVECRLREHSGTVHRPEPGSTGRALACPAPGSLASLLQRHRATKLRMDGAGRSARLLFTNAPKPRFASITYERARNRVVYELRHREDDSRMQPWRLHRVVELITALRDGAATRLRQAYPAEHAAIERALIGRKADGSDPSPTEQRTRIIPLPSIGHTYADHAIRRVLLDVPSGAPLAPDDVEWAFSGLEAPNLGPFVLTRAEADDMLRHYHGPSRHWRSITAVALPENAKRRRIEPKRIREESKSGSERIEEEGRAASAVQVALRHAGIRASAIGVRVQREPFDARGARVETFAEGTRFVKERLWHVELELDRPMEGPLVIGDGRFLGLGVMAPVTEPWPHDARETRADRRGPIVGAPVNRSGLFGLAVEGDARDEPIALARALRRAVMARAQAELGSAPLGRFFTGHERNGTKVGAEHATHLSFQWDATRRRLLVIAPHWLDRREPWSEERRCIDILDRALDKLIDLRAGSAGRFTLRRQSLVGADPLLATAQSWSSITPYAVTRHQHAPATEVLAHDVLVECLRRRLPRPTVRVLETHGVPNQGLEGPVRLDFPVAVTGPIILGRTRYLGGGLFAPSP